MKKTVSAYFFPSSIVYCTSQRVAHTFRPHHPYRVCLRSRSKKFATRNKNSSPEDLLQAACVLSALLSTRIFGMLSPPLLSQHHIGKPIWTFTRLDIFLPLCQCANVPWFYTHRQRNFMIYCTCRWGLPRVASNKLMPGASLMMWQISVMGCQVLPPRHGWWEVKDVTRSEYFRSY